ncbi:MAG: hypothetical protein HZB91_14155 [Elusimicrobia bacterium]|nr:hypothetical protein [Elusimicrobiota bacterium]
MTLLASLLTAAALAAPPSKPPEPVLAAVHVYNLVRAEGTPTFCGPRGTKDKCRVRTRDNVEVHVTDEAAGPSRCDTIFGTNDKVDEALTMGLPVPYMIEDRGCTGKLKTMKVEWTGTLRQPAKLTQKQVNILFMLVEDCLVNGGRRSER